MTVLLSSNHINGRFVKVGDPMDLIKKKTLFENNVFTVYFDSPRS